MRSPTCKSGFALLLAVALLCVLGVRQTVNAQEPAGQSGESVIVLAAGDIAKCNLEWDMYTGALLDNLPGTILGLGDNAQYIGSLQEFQECYEPVWGRHKDRIYPVPGNHEYLTGGAEGYFNYFGDRATPLEPGCRKECKGYYSFNLGNWHIVALNSEINNEPGSEQDLWLRADLAAHPNVCTLAYWHKPRWSSGYHRSGASAPLFQAAYDYGVDIVLSGHDHDYERFGPQNPQGVLEPDRGVRQFVVGTGGADHRGWRVDQLNSEARDPDTWGVLKLTLHPTSYDWEFIPIAGQTFTDSGSANCVTFGSAPAASVGAQPVLVSTTAGAGGSAVGESPAVEISADETGTGTVADMGADTGADTGAAAPAAAATATLPAEGLDYVVQAGDTLSLISMRYGLDWEVVAQVNGITNTEVIEVGQVIRLPGVDETSVVVPISLPAATAAATTTTAPATGAAGAAGGITYTVQTGDTLFGIALQANVTLQALLAANNMQEDDFLQIGQVLTIPGRTTPLRTTSTAATTTPALAATTATTRTTVAAAGGTAAGGTAAGGIAAGGTVTGVAAAAGATATRAVTATTPALLPQPTAVTATTAATAGGSAVHVVGDGDTIITIALEYDLDWQELLALNGLGADTILQIGQQIRLR